VPDRGPVRPDLRPRSGAAGLPTAVTLACGGGEAQWERLSPLLARPALRPYYSDDVIGAESAARSRTCWRLPAAWWRAGARPERRAALIARGYAEMVRFGLALGARAETLAGLCGLGDLVLTCSSTSSRNFSLGKALGEGRARPRRWRAKTALPKARTPRRCWPIWPALRCIAMPIVEAVDRLLSGAAPAAVVAELLARPLKAEGRARIRGRVSEPSAAHQRTSQALAKGGRTNSSALCCGSARGCRS
jgi:glycerol-3-phosphate dehydrogenase (NAD(P)+)